MSTHTIETLKRMLHSATDETDDTDLSFTLRQAGQLLRALEEQRCEAIAALDDAEIDPAVRDDLYRLGYFGRPAYRLESNGLGPSVQSQPGSRL